MLWVSQRSIGYYILVIASIGILASSGLAQETEYSPKRNTDYSKFNPAPENEKLKDSFREGSLVNIETAKKAKDLAELRLQARRYRKEGLEFQSIGQLDEAISSYQKAILLDPFYVESYNDLGVTYEMKGSPDRALGLYLTALEIDPDYLATYSNLASIYEGSGDLKKAAYYWKKRVKLGSSDDYWTQKAQMHLENIALVDEEIAQELREEEILDLIKGVKAESQKARSSPNKTDEERQKDEKKKKAIEYLKSARMKFKDGNLVSALNDAGIAQHLDPSNTEIEKFIEEIHKEIKNTYSR